jgi:hypothetical protein|eukprot:COSAG02_NODE_3588_length_6517_cov_12.149335_4_plen_120_part_00
MSLSLACVAQHNPKCSAHRFCSSPKQLVTNCKHREVLIPNCHPPDSPNRDRQPSCNCARCEALQRVLLCVRNKVNPFVVVADQSLDLIQGDRRLELQSDRLRAKQAGSESANTISMCCT